MVQEEDSLESKPKATKKKHRFNSENAAYFGAKGGKRSGEAKRENASIAAATKQALQQYVTDPVQLEIIKKSGMPVPKKPRYLDFLVASVLSKSVKKGNVDDLLKFMQITGESPDTAAVTDNTAEDALTTSLKELAAEMDGEKNHD